MLQEVCIAVSIGLVGLVYGVAYETLVTVRGFKKYGTQWVIFTNRRRVKRLLGFTLLWPAMEEAVIRGLPMLFIEDKRWLVITLVSLNVLFMLAHLDRDIIRADSEGVGPLRRCSWSLSRFGRGLLFLVPAIGFSSLYGCILLHAAWNLQAVTVQLRSSQFALWHGRIVLAIRPFEILAETRLQPSRGFRRLFRNMRTYYAKGI